EAAEHLPPRLPGGQHRGHQRTRRRRKPPGVRASAYSSASMRPASFASPFSRSRAVTLSSPPVSSRTQPASSSAAPSGSHRITRRTPVTVRRLRDSKIRSWGAVSFVFGSICSPPRSLVIHRLCGGAGGLFRRALRDDLVHLPGHVLGAGLGVRQDPHLDRPVAEGDLNDVAGGDGGRSL